MKVNTRFEGCKYIREKRPVENNAGGLRLQVNPWRVGFPKEAALRDNCFFGSVTLICKRQGPGFSKQQTARGRYPTVTWLSLQQFVLLLVQLLPKKSVSSSLSSSAWRFKTASIDSGSVILYSDICFTSFHLQINRPIGKNS